MENEIINNTSEEINSTVPMETDVSAVSIVGENAIVATGESSNNNTFSTPTCSEEEDDFILTLNYSSTPGATEQWIRTVEDDFTPKCGMFFLNLEDGLEFYSIYAFACGFDVRKYTTGKQKDSVAVKSVVCNRQGHRDMKRKLRLESNNKEAGSWSTTENNKTKTRQPKKNRLTRCGCQAKMRLRTCAKTDERPAGYIVDQFREVHNHPLYSVKNREFQKLSRDVHDYIKRTIIDHTKLNRGPTLSYRILKEYSNGYQNVGTYLIDFKNFKRDVKCYIGDTDASMFIGVDHNKNTVNFGAGLLEFECQESFEWIFGKFLDAMGQTQPQCIIIDQFPGIKKVCLKFFTNAIHKYCMWHIMQEVPEKVGRTICNETNFMTDINDVVWEIDLEPHEFEEN
ncbi:protein FAR1-RELATED SEQUENCE 5-like [Silene latifolia]|uniref:protein FAR1-RELATED SEQUENCE 5-like n=1 Tax=Silene latifolia TaxID=37657 RepID=UPI003D77BDED